MSVLDTIDYGAFSKDPTADNAREAFRKTDDNFTALNTDKAELSGAEFTGNISIGDNTQIANFPLSVDNNNIIDGGSLALLSGLGTTYWFLGRRTDGSLTISDNANGELFNLFYTNGFINLPGVYAETTASAANVFVHTDGSIRRSTSSERFKDILEKIKPEFSKNIYEIAKKCTLFYKSKCEGDNSDWTWYGLSAEKLAEIEPRLVHWGYFEEDYEFIEKEVIRKVKEKDKKTGKVSEKEVKQIEKERVLKKDAKLSPVGVQYERFIPLMLVEMNWQKDELESLKKDIAELKELLKK